MFIKCSISHYLQDRLNLSILYPIIKTIFSIKINYNRKLPQKRNEHLVWYEPPKLKVSMEYR